MSDRWRDLNIPDAWTATAMLRNMFADHLGPGKAFETALDDETRERMIGLAIMGHVELAGKTARLVEQFSILIEEVGQIATQSNALREALVQLAEHVDERFRD